MFWLIGEALNGINNVYEMERACKSEMLRQQRVMEKKMTREEAINKCSSYIKDAGNFIAVFEALGLINFEEKKEVNTVISTHADFMDYGVIRVEHWPEGLVLWVGGKIKYKSWENKKEKPKATFDTRTLIFSSQSPCAYQAIGQLEAIGYEIKYNVFKDGK